MKIQNRERLHRRIAALPQITKDEIRKGLADSAQEITELQKRFVPVDTGELRDSIVWQYGNTTKIAHSQGVGGDHELSVRISAGDTYVRYAHLVEFGTAPHPQGGKFKGTMHPGTAAHPFFYPGYRLGQKRAKSRIGRAVSKAAKKAAGVA